MPKPKVPVPAVYSLEVMVELTGLSSDAILLYQEAGLVAPVSVKGSGRRKFDEEALRTLRRIEHLQARYDMNLRSLRLTLRLLDELDQLQTDLRARRWG